MPLKFNLEMKDAFISILPTITRFRDLFGRDISIDFIAELYAARELDLELPDKSNEPGYDAIDSNGQKYEIKYRSPSTLNVDINNFDFDHLVLINLSSNYNLLGMWRLPVEKVKEIFTFQKNHRKYQATQKKVKSMAVRIL